MVQYSYRRESTAALRGFKGPAGKGAAPEGVDERGILPAPPGDYSAELDARRGEPVKYERRRPTGVRGRRDV
jgi:hypothetical protein